VKKIGSTGFLLFILYTIWIQPASAQSPNDQKREIEQLKDKLEQLDQMMKEISALENQRQNPAVPPSAVPPTAALATAVAPLAKNSADGNKGDSENMLSLYGYVMLDAGQNFKQIDPNWFDVMRPTKLPAFKNEFAPHGTTFGAFARPDSVSRHPTRRRLAI
jgi:hypothetical protein